VERSAAGASFREDYERVVDRAPFQLNNPSNHHAVLTYRKSICMSSKSLRIRLTGIVVISFGLLVASRANAEADVAHAVTGIVRHVDHASKVLVLKAEDGTEHTIKYTDKTSVKTGKHIDREGADAWLATKEGAKVTVHYTSKTGDETAIAVKDAAEKTGEYLKN
jgi:hypothetical protein